MSTLTPIQRRQRYTLLLIALLFLLPLALSFYLYYGSDGWRPGGQVNYGELLIPPRPLPAVTLRQPDGVEVHRPFEGAWSLILVGTGACNDQCRKALYVMRQVRLALNQDSGRVRRVLLYHGECCEQPYFSREQSGLIVLDIDSVDGAPLREAFAAVNSPPAQSARIWLSDPLGNLMMVYPVDVEPKGLLRDLKRLLKLSHIG